MDRLDGRVAIVTGAGRGIGQAIAAALAARGASVVLAARTRDEVDLAASEIAERGGRAIGVVADVADGESVRAMVAAAAEAFGEPDVLVNNAGIQGPIGPLAEVDEEAWAQVIDINLVGLFRCCKAVLPGMIRRQAGRIINLSGGGATAPRPNFSAYASSKVAVVRLTETLAEEVREFGITVNAIAPGAVNTRMLQETLKAGDAAGREAAMALNQRDGGGAPPEKAAELVAFLASDAAAGITGKLISALHDSWEGWDAARIADLMERPWFTLRRMDPHTIRPFTEVEV